MTIATATKNGSVYEASGSGLRWVLDNEIVIQGSANSCTYSLKEIIEIPNDTVGEVTTPTQVKQAITDMVLASELSADEITAILSAYEPWIEGEALEVDDLRTYGGKLYKVNQTHTTQSNWTPDITPALFYRCCPAGVIPEWVQPTSAQDAYNIGDQVTYEGSVYESLIDANVWSPTVYPAGWQLIE